MTVTFALYLQRLTIEKYRERMNQAVCLWSTGMNERLGQAWLVQNIPQREGTGWQFTLCMVVSLNHVCITIKKNPCL